MTLGPLQLETKVGYKRLSQFNSRRQADSLHPMVSALHHSMHCYISMSVQGPYNCGSYLI